jgi:hypothetical protein
VKPQLRPGKRPEQADQCTEKQAALRAAPGTRDRSRQLMPQMRGYEPCERGVLTRIV